MRMMAAYFGTTQADVKFEGLWSTPTYISPGPLPDLRPDRPWDVVLQSRPSPFGHGRRMLWKGTRYTLSAAPALDATEYGGSWYAPERDMRGVFQWLGGPGEIVVSNRGPSPRRAVLSLGVQSFAEPRRVRLVAGPEDAQTVTAPAGVPAPARIALDLPARSTRVVALSAEPGPRSAGEDPRQLMIAIRDVRVTSRAAPGARVT